MKQYSIFINLLFLSLSLTACVDSQEQNFDDIYKVNFVHGEPSAIAASPLKNKQVPFSLKNYSEYNNYKITSIQNFVKKGTYSIQSNRNIEQENSTSKKRKKLLHKAFKFNKEEANIFSFSGQLDIYKFDLKFKSLSDGSFVFHEYRDQNITNISKKNTTTELIHFSETIDRSSISFLIETTSTTNTVLTAIYLTKMSSDKPLENIKKNIYNYFSGQGIMIPWNQQETVHIELCVNKKEMQIKNGLNLKINTDSILAWNSLFENRLDVSYSEPSAWYPFSDLNQHCLYIIEGYQTEADPSAINFGATILIPANDKIIDSDVLIFAGEFKKYIKILQENNTNPNHPKAVAFMQERLDYTIIHEMGHFWGLGHEFEKDSVMSYEDRRLPNISKTDSEAIKELYPLK